MYAHYQEADLAMQAAVLAHGIAEPRLAEHLRFTLDSPLTGGR
jgi:hypothetical protein